MSASETDVHTRGWRQVLLARCKGLATSPTAVARPCDAASLNGAIDAAAEGLILPILVGPEAKIRAAACAWPHCGPIAAGFGLAA